MPAKNDFGPARFLKPNEEQVKAREKRNSVVRACFSTPAGKEVLAYLKEKYLDKPVCVINNVYYGYVREGQNEVVRAIIQYSKEK